MPPILDQGSLGTCGPCQLSNALRYCSSKMRDAMNDQPSRLFIYFFARMLDGTPVAQDDGITIKNGLQAIKRFGAPSESLWPYTATKFATQPSKDAFTAAKSSATKAFEYYSVKQDIEYIKQAILAGFPVVLGIAVYSALDSVTAMQTGIVTMPNKQTEVSRGGHCVSLWGWDDTTQMFLMMNTFGGGVGDQGWFTIPYAYITDPDLAFDMYTIQFWK
jgi:C1A family cysteine protease